MSKKEILVDKIKSFGFPEKDSHISNARQYQSQTNTNIQDRQVLLRDRRMAQDHSHCDHDRNNQITSPGNKGEQAFLPVHRKDSPQVLIHYFQESKMMNEQRQYHPGARE